LVTGGSAGIGLGIAKRFAQEGARVFIAGRPQFQLDEAAASIGGDAAAIQGDTTDLADLDRIFAEIQAQAGRIDALAVNAGVYEFGTFGEITEEHFDKTFNTNVRGLLFTVQKALPLLTKGSSVILTGSMASIKGYPSLSVYNASKAAVRSFARIWIVDLKGRDTRINVLSPGMTATPGLSHFMTEEEKASAIATVPLGCPPTEVTSVKVVEKDVSEEVAKGQAAMGGSFAGSTSISGIVSSAMPSICM
jgi:NAD(P)-dependent dehydrogenase (short-subunit alcohol dehydrogenase family)